MTSGALPDPPTSPAGQMNVPAFIFRKGGTAKLIPLQRVLTLIGSRSPCQLRLKSPEVSGCHAVLLNRDGRLYLRDLNSRRGVYCNGEVVRDRLLRLGDRIGIGPYEFQVEGVSEGDSGARVTRRPLRGEIWVEGGSSGPVGVDEQVFLIGRREGSDLTIGSDLVSAAHAVIVSSGSSWSVVDLGSRTGTLLNGRRVALSRITDGSLIEIGGTRMTFRVPRASPGAGRPTEPEQGNGLHGAPGDRTGVAGTWPGGSGVGGHAGGVFTPPPERPAAGEPTGSIDASLGRFSESSSAPVVGQTSRLDAIPLDDSAPPPEHGTTGLPNNGHRVAERSLNRTSTVPPGDIPTAAPATEETHPADAPHGTFGDAAMSRVESEAVADTLPASDSDAPTTQHVASPDHAEVGSGAFAEEPPTSGPATPANAGTSAVESSSPEGPIAPQLKEWGPFAFAVGNPELIEVWGASQRDSAKEVRAPSESGVMRSKSRIRWGLIAAGGLLLGLLALAALGYWWGWWSAVV